MHACVCSNHSISPPIILQSSNLSLYSMFALLHCTIRMTRDKQCHLGFYGVQKSQNQLQSEILLFLSNYTIKIICSGVSPPPPGLQIGSFPAPRSRMQA